MAFTRQGSFRAAHWPVERRSDCIAMSGHVHPTELIDLPELICPFPSATNPHAAVVEERAIEWGRRFKIITDNRVLDACACGQSLLLVAWAYPHAPIEALQLIADWNIWLLIWEDRCSSPELGTQPERLEAIHARFLAILSGAPSTAQDLPLASMGCATCANGCWPKRPTNGSRNSTRASWRCSTAGFGSDQPGTRHETRFQPTCACAQAPAHCRHICTFWHSPIRSFCHAKSTNTRTSTS